MSISETIKDLESAGKKIKKAKDLEVKAQTAHREAAAMRDEADQLNREATEAKEETQRLMATHKTISDRQGDDLRTREKTLAGKLVDFQNANDAAVKLAADRENQLNARTSELDNAETACKELMAELKLREANYNSIAEFINKTI